MLIPDTIKRRFSKPVFELDDPRFKKQQQVLRRALEIDRFYGEYPLASQHIIDECIKIENNFGRWQADFAFYLFALFANSPGKDKILAERISILKAHKVLPDLVVPLGYNALRVQELKIKKGHKSKYIEVKKLPGNGHLLSPNELRKHGSFSSVLTDSVYKVIHEAIKEGPRKSTAGDILIETSFRVGILRHVISALKNGYSID